MSDRRPVIKAPDGFILILVLRQVRTGQRLKLGFTLNADLWPVPEHEAAAHVLFDIASGAQERPQDSAALADLIETYIPTSERVQ
jgi:hypothetical protein